MASLTGPATLPLWALFAIGVGTPILAFLGALVGHRVARKSATELETRSKREEIMRNLRWASELAVADDQRKADLGLAQLNALGDSNLSDSDVQGFIQAAIEVALAPALSDIDEAGDDADVVVVDEADTDIAGGVLPVESSGPAVEPEEV